METSFPILIVEDDMITRRIMERVFLKHNYKVEIAENGKQALQKLSVSFFPIVISDWQMPEMDGIELCKFIRKQKYEGYVFFILLSSHSTKKDIIHGLQAGADEYLSKPINPAELIARISTAKRILKLERTLIKANSEIKKLSITDPLTKAFNRGYLEERMPIEMKRAQRYNNSLSLILSDIDFFKKVNDVYGHQAGDKVLKEFVKLLKHSTRTNVDFVVRFGGEEFLVILPETDLKTAMKIAERIRNSTEMLITKHQQHQIKITASFGVATFKYNNKEDYNYERLVSEADKNLYKSKKTGRNKVTGPN